MNYELCTMNYELCTMNYELCTMNFFAAAKVLPFPCLANT